MNCIVLYCISKISSLGLVPQKQNKFNIVINILSHILSHFTQTIPILQNLNQVVVQVINYPGPLGPQWTTTKTRQPQQCAGLRNQAPVKKKKINLIQNRKQSNKTHQALRYIPFKAETKLPWAALHGQPLHIMRQKIPRPTTQNHK
jgi:hypothetical protein